MPRFNSDGPPKSGATDFQIAKSWNWSIFKLWIQIYVPKISELEECSIYGNRPSIYVQKGWYDETSKKVAITIILGAKAFLPPPRGIIILKRHEGKG